MGQFTSEWHISDEKLQMSTDEIISDFGLAKNDQLSWLVGKGNRKKQTKTDYEYFLFHCLKWNYDKCVSCYANNCKNFSPR